MKTESQNIEFKEFRYDASGLTAGHPAEKNGPWRIM